MSTELSGRDLAPVMERLVRLVREVSTAGEVSTTGAAVIARLGRLGGQRITDLARAEGVSQPAMTQLVNRLEGDGLVRRAADSADRRGVLVETTDRGREVIDARRTQRAEALEAALGRLDATDRAAIAAALPALDRLVDAVLDS
ncbi:MarR family winged helix-turn-helix transcriptional regulator [Nocardioides albus]|uniref:DNA-binding MarR family transcriptional regulator n=1 Tax=Nocardioides albus TaxID=1841 RepID=A0A7W5F8N5_9ACTN|nr:MarR family transcriptional regulator [Nocardioides albus]MBB3089380.1 DNA-binding MarR family transcriptional regulator [Nocardioides albus]